MSKLMLVVALLCALQMAQCRTVRETAVAESTATLPTTLADLVKQTDDAFKSLQANFLTFVGVKDTNELTTLLQTQTKSAAEKLQATVAQITEEAKKSPANQLLTDFTSRLNTQVEDWKRENPDVVLTAEKYKENFESGLKTVAAETQDFSAKLATQGEGVNENVQKLLRQLYDNTLEATKTVASQIETAANKN